MSDPAIERPTLARHIYPGMIKKLEEAGNLQVGSTELSPDEETIAIQVLQAMIAKTQELFPAGKAGEVDKAGQKVLRGAIAGKKIAGDRAQAIWKALFQNPTNRYALIEAALMKKLCAGTRPTLASHIYPDMQVELSAFEVEGAKLTSEEVLMVEQMLGAMVVETQKLFPAAAAGEVDKAGQKVLRGAIAGKKIAGDRAQVIWKALFQTSNNLYKTVETSLMQSTCAPLFPSISGFLPPTVNPGATTTITILGERFPSDAKVEFLDGAAVDSSITTGTPTVAPDGKSMTVTLTVPSDAKKGTRAIKISSAKYPQLSAVLPDGLEIKSAPSITSILPAAIFADGEPLPIQVKAENLLPGDLKLDIVDGAGNSIIGGEKPLTTDQITITGSTTVIGTLATDAEDKKKVRITIPPETAAGTYYLVLKDAKGEIVRKAFTVHKVTVPEGAAKIWLRKALNSKTVAMLNPELSVGAGGSNFGLQDHEITGQHPLTTNYPRGDFEQTPNWDIAARLSPRFHLLGGGKVQKPDFAPAATVVDLTEIIWDTLVKKGYIDKDGKIQSKFDGNRETFDLGIALPAQMVTQVFDVLQEKSGKLQVSPEVHAGWQKFHNFSDSTEGTNRLNTGAGVSLSTNQLIQSLQLVPRYSLLYNYSQNAEQYPSLAHPAGDEHTFANSLQLAWKPLRLFFDPEDSWLVARLGITHQASQFNYWERTLGFPFDGWSQRLVLNGGLDLNFSELTPHWAVPNLTVNGAGTLWGYRDVPDSLVGSWQKRLTGWAGDAKLQWPRVWNTYLAGGYAEETAGGSIKLFHRWGGAGVMPPGWGTFDLRAGSTNNNPYYLTSKIYGELTWLPPEKLWFLPQLTAGGAQLHDQPADRTFPEVYGKAKYSVIDLIRKLVE